MLLLMRVGLVDLTTHHDHVVLMERDERGLVCPECGRVQAIPGR